MLVRYVWRGCDFRNRHWGASPINAFWVEATLEEAEERVFPVISSEAIEESKQFAEKGESIVPHIKGDPRPYCFLVAKDLSSIDPFPVHYPFSNQWNAYSPFRYISEITIERLEDLRSIVLPVPLSDELRQFVCDEKWVFAKTYAKTWPHEYLVKDRVDQEMFVALVKHIREHGYQGSFYKKPITYFDEDGMVYWTMGGVPDEEETIVNRCPKKDSYEYKRDHGLLPERQRESR